MDRLTGMQVFVRVVETGSFSRAAADLRLTQPTVTKHVAALEKHMRCRLLNRNTRGVSTTTSGALFYERCKAVLHEVELADQLAGGDHTGIQGLLRVTTSVALGRLVIAPLLIEFVRGHPDLRIDLGFDDRYVDLVAQGTDLAIRMGRLADSSHGARHLGFNPWIMVASPAYLAARGAPRRAAELAKHECLVYSSVQGDDVWQLVGPAGAQETIPVRGRVRSSDLSTVLAAAGAGMGIAILPHYVATASIEAGDVCLIMTDHTVPGQEVHAVFPSPKLVPRKVLAVIDFLSRRFAPGWWLGPGQAGANGS